MVDVDSIRVFLHLLGVAGWIGGQMVMVGLLPLLRTLGPDAPCLAAARFARMAWPCFGLAIATGIWGLFAINLDDRDTGYLTVLLMKLLLVGLSGSAAATHATTRSGAVRGATGVLGALAALGALLAPAPCSSPEALSGARIQTLLWTRLWSPVDLLGKSPPELGNTPPPVDSGPSYLQHASTPNTARGS